MTGPRVTSDRPPFVPVPNAFARDPSFSDKAFRLDVLLGTWANHGDEDPQAWPSVATLASMMGCHSGTVRRALVELVDRGRVKIESGKAAGEPNLYHLLDPEGRAPVNYPPVRGRAPAREGGRAPAREGVAHPRASNKNQLNKNQEQEPSAPLGAEIERATDDPLVNRARDLAMLAFEQTPKPITKFPAVMARVEEALRAGYSVQALESVIRAGDVVWTQPALTLALGRTKPRADPVRRGGNMRAEMAETDAAYERQQANQGRTHELSR